MQNTNPRELTAQEMEDRETLRDLLQHPGWKMFEQQCKIEMQDANARRRSALLNPSVDAVALLTINCEARIDMIQNLIAIVYSKAGVSERPGFIKLGGFGEDRIDNG